MVVFPNCKINLGLFITARRADGYHDIETVMVPVPWCDILEIVPSPDGSDRLTVTGNTLGDCPPEKNLVMRAVRALRQTVEFPAVDIHLHKIIPDGAGLGGGSSDAAFTVTTLNSLFGLGMSQDQMADVCATVGSDCPFFVYNRPMLATGRGTDLTAVDIPDLAGYTLVIVKAADAHVSTAQAYAGVTPRAEAMAIPDILARPVDQWSALLVNHFEDSVMAKAPSVAAVKQQLDSMGAVYTAMTGSGAAVFGLFDKPFGHDTIQQQFPGCQSTVCSL